MPPVNDLESNITKRTCCVEMVLGNRYACDANGRFFYPKDRDGNEYMRPELRLIQNDNGQYVYPLTRRGNPRYYIENGQQVYEIINGKPIYGIGIDGKQYYAVNKYGDEYYPEDNTPAKLADSTIYYASSKTGSHIFPIDANGNEYYFTHVDITRPSTIPNRYARSSLGDEIYPLRITLHNNEEQFMINNTYAVDKNNVPFYPKDGYRNEYYKIITSTDVDEYRRQGTMTKILLNRYAVTNDGNYILPQMSNIYIIIQKMMPFIDKENVIGQLIRDDNRASDYLTNVSNDLLKSPVVKAYKYKTMVTKEIRLVIPKPNAPTLNIFKITSLTNNNGRCFWIWIIIILMIKMYVLWRFVIQKYFFNKTEENKIKNLKINLIS